MNFRIQSPFDSHYQLLFLNINRSSEIKADGAKNLGASLSNLKGLTNL
jgi:hypothetical protein